jgi:putative membrane protein
MKRLLVFLAASLLIPGAALVNGNNAWHMGGRRHMMWFDHGDVLIWIMLLALIGVVVYLVVKSGKVKTTEDLLRESPIEILKKCYAKGEITKEQFEQMKKDLQA